MRTNEIHSTVGREVECRGKRFLVMLCSLLDPEWKGKPWKERTQLHIQQKYFVLHLEKWRTKICPWKWCMYSMAKVAWGFVGLAEKVSIRWEIYKIHETWFCLSSFRWGLFVDTDICEHGSHAYKQYLSFLSGILECGTNSASGFKRLRYLYFRPCGPHKRESQWVSLWLLLAGYRDYEERQDSVMGISRGKIKLTLYYRKKVSAWWLCLLMIVIMYSWRNFRKNNCEQDENIWLCYSETKTSTRMVRDGREEFTP